MEHQPKVRAEYCHHRSTDEEVYRALAAATEPLNRSWSRLKQARTIALKFNQDYPVSRMFKCNRKELVSDSVVRAVLRLLRERTTAQLVCVDASYMKIYNDARLEDTTQIAHLLEEFDVRYIDCTEPPFQDVKVPDENGLFGYYRFNAELLAADEIVSIAKVKNHKFMGVTGTLKNLFGLMPAEPYTRPRNYYHHLIRMPFMLCDIGRIFDPALNILDGLVSQAGREWSKDTTASRTTDMIIAGDNAVGTDTCMIHLMGHDPEADWGTDPFVRDRNAIAVCAEHAYGTNRLAEIDFASGVSPRSSGTFFNNLGEDAALVSDWRRTMCEQALHYRDHISDYTRYTGEYILIQKGNVVWHDAGGKLQVSRRYLAGNDTHESLFYKYVDPEEKESERFEIYEQTLAQMGR